ncbi:MAG: low temperature requirement protein A [Humibacillus sp.]
MRFAMVVMWLRAAASHPEGRPSALRFAVGIALVQVLWIARLLIDGRALLLASFVVLVAFELLVPVLAGRRGFTPFHPHHIAERYALLTLIVLGEVILAAVQAVQGALVDGGRPGLLALAVGGLLLVFASVAATGAALAAAVELVQGEAEASNRVVGLGVTVLVTGLVLAAVVCYHVWTSQRQSTGWSSPLSTS